MKIDNLNNQSLKKKREEYLQNGFTIYRNFLNLSIIKAIKKELKVYLKKQVNLKKKQFHLTKDNKINSVHNIKFNWIRKLQNLKKTKKITSSLLGDNPKKFGAELFAKPAKTGLNVPIHQDNFYWNTKTGNALTMWIALNESNKKNGGIFYFKKSHKTGLQKHKLSFHPGTSQKLSEKINLKKFKKFTPSLKPGDCIVHNSLIIHGSNKNLSNKTRSGLTLRYISKNEKFDNFKIAKYKKSLEKNVKFLKENN